MFVAAAAALVLSTAVAVGLAAERYLTVIPLKPIAGIGFILIGGWTVLVSFRRPLGGLGNQFTRR